MTMALKGNSQLATLFPSAQKHSITTASKSFCTDHRTTPVARWLGAFASEITDFGLDKKIAQKMWTAL